MQRQKLIERVNPRWLKVIRDIWENKARTALVVLAIAVGVFAFGSVFITQDVLITDMNQGFSEVNPATITITLTPFEEGLERTVRTIPGVVDAEPRAVHSIKMEVTPGNWANVDLYAVPDFEEIRINKIALEQGQFPPGRREVFFERTAIPVLRRGLGDEIKVELADGTVRTLTINGVVHDFNAIPANIFPQYTGYTSLATLEYLDYPAGTYNLLNIRTDPSFTTIEEVQDVANEVADRLKNYGYFVIGVQTLKPGQHWAADVTAAFNTVLGVIGFLSLALSAFLVINTISSILAQQKRQVGMMKAVGARAGQVMGIYLVMAGVFGALSLFVALPVGYYLALVLTSIVAQFLNINILNFHIPPEVLVLQVATALVTPLIAALIPVIAGTRVSVREAVSDYGIGDVTKKEGLIDRLITAIKGLPRPTMLSLRNTFRRKGRLALTLVTLTTAGAIFVAVLNLRGSLFIELDSIMNVFGYDVFMVFDGAQRVSRLQQVAERVEGVNRVEGWGFANVTPIKDDGTDGAAIVIFAPPIDSPFIDPTMEEGRWLQEGDTNHLVISSQVKRDNPFLDVGDIVELDFGDTKRKMEIVGIVSLVGPNFAYANFDYITRLQGAPGQSFVAMVGTDQSDAPFQARVGRELEELFKRSGIGVSQTQTTATIIGAQVGQFNFFIGFMLFMAVLLAVVGGLALASTMSLNVLERTREIGVMRSIGAADGSVRSVFLTEGVLIGVISWALAAILSLPISWLLAQAIGAAFFERPLVFSVAPVGFVAWLIIVLIISAVASLLPAHRASQVSVRESLAYE